MKKLSVLFIIILQSCFPKFTQEKIVKEIRQGKIDLKWVDVIGTLDQNFPDYIIVEKDGVCDTLCKAHNITDVQIKNDTIIVCFDGIPQKYDTHIIIPQKILGYKVVVVVSDEE